MEELLKVPREAGTPEADEARERIAGFLRSAGYDVEVQRFRFSGGALLAFPLLGAGLGWLCLIEIPLLLLQTPPPWAALAAWLTGLAALGVLTAGLAFGWSRLGDDREDATLIARRPGATVRRWIVAHHDTKAQRHSMAGRLIAVWAIAVVIPGITGLTIWRLWGALPPLAVAAGTGAALAAGILAGRGRLSGKSPGARDNGTGLLAALRIAARTQSPETGILITGAEEFGLIGARILARTSPGLIRNTEVINLDTIDSTGPIRLVAHDRAGRELARQLIPTLKRLDLPVKLHHLPVGIFVDSLPLARAGARAVTVARLDWSTLRLIHTPRDTLEGLDLDAAERVADWLGVRC